MMNPVDFTIARFKHLNWKFRVRSFLDGKETLTQEQAISHRHCDLGKWYYAEGKAKYGHLPSMQAFEKEHEVLHAIVQQIVHLKEENLLKEAEELYKKLMTVSDTIMNLLEEAEKEINAKADHTKSKITVGAS
ncbi:MAG: CZB domain-containing protein [Flammeovirgaceae bacterium]|nr:CZB domain-containing protein [Flammeovirgaceae bacterium]